tara:strand:- start:7442 stop:7726 length:285 start_codon:yes stop_codon:yes gene_type:complete
MGLKKLYISKWGGTHANAYHRINGIHWVPLHHGSGSLNVQVHSYDTQEARTAGSESLAMKQYSWPLTGSINENWVSQSYEHLKTTSDFSGSVDV